MHRKFTTLISLALVLQACASPVAASTQQSVAVQPSASAPTDIQHKITPGSGSEQLASAHDNDESINFKNKDVQSGDQFNINRYERPLHPGT